MKERVHTFGQQGNLVGIYTEPQSDGYQRPVVVTLNAGLLHRVGPSRLHVELTRELAAAGYGGFRFDMGGIGDSAAATAGLPGTDRYAEDIREALDFLSTEYGARSFVLVGLCSGADYSHIGAVADDRVVAMVLIDGYAYPTHGFRLRKYAPKLTSPRKVIGFLARRAREQLAMRAARREGIVDELDVFSRNFPPRAQIRRELSWLAGRGVKMYFVYSGGQEHLNYREQFADMFPGLDTSSIQVDYLPMADHTFIIAADRRDLRARIATWLTRNLPGELQTKAEPDQRAQSELESESFVF